MNSRRSAKGHEIKNDFWPIARQKTKSHTESMKKIIENLGSERLTGLVTILTVAAICLFILLGQEQPNYPRVMVTVLLFINFLMLEIILTQDDLELSNTMHIVLNLLQVGTVYALFFTVSFTFLAILLCVWCGNLLHYMKLKSAIVISSLFLVAYGAIYGLYWEYSHMHLSAPLYWMLCIFTMVMINSWAKESQAKEASQELNRELLVAQSLLKEATKQSERVRIARDIHDLVGHHLTALTINLQVAMHQTEGEGKQQVEKSYAIAKLLLADVRDAVTEIREKSNIQIRDSLEALLSSIPRLKVDLELQENLSITNVELAETILKCVQESITNSLKHSDSSQFHISLYRNSGDLKLQMQDNGSNKHNVVPGNGLVGMQERVAIFKGRAEFSSSTRGFNTLISIPETI